MPSTRTLRTTIRRQALGLLLGSVLTSGAGAAPIEELFDFWIGDWNVSWTNADGSVGHARNQVRKILDGRVIEEQFEQDGGDPPPHLTGRSLSVLHQASGTWRQAWADNQGGFFAFTGFTDGPRRIFATELRNRDGRMVGQRMVFYDIEASHFGWDWESTADGGVTWQLRWRLRYQRR